VADYFKATGAVVSDPPFLDVVVIDFAVADAAQHHHVPLLVSPFAYSTYRGS
jgi:5-hydroxyisourate hydrolase